MYASSVTCTALQEVSWLFWSPDLVSRELAVFRVSLSDGARWMPRLRRVLSPDEIDRVARYHRPDDQLRFSCTRSVLRLLLARYLRQPPDRIEFVPGINRKPGLKQPGSWQFNVAHSGDWILIGIGKNPVGVDLEWVNPEFSYKELIPSSFGFHEQQYLRTSQDIRFSFCELWTRKEALVKATAAGISSQFGQVPSIPGTHPVSHDLIGANGHWTVRSFRVAGSYPAAVAYEELPHLVPQFYTLDPGLFVGLD